MTKSRILFCFSIVAILSVWVIIRPKSTHSAAQAPMINNDPFSQESALSHYASSQPRHWRQMLMKQ